MPVINIKDVPLIGRWRKSIDPLLLDDSDFTDIQNLRYLDRGLKSVNGMAKVNTTALTTYTKIRSGFHFVKDEPAETHVLVQAWNSGETASNVYQNTTAIPNQGNFSGTVVLDETGATVGKGRFSDAPRGQVAYCNEKGSYIWAGNEIPCSGFVVYDPATVASYDYTPKVQNKRTSSDQLATITKAGDSKGYLYIGATRPIEAIKFYVQTANATAGSMSGSYWNGSGWVALASLSDGTSAGSCTLAQTGTVTFTAQAAAAYPSVYKGIVLYWYKIELSAVDNTTKIYYCTVRPTWTTVRNLWDGSYRLPAAVKRYMNNYEDFTLDCNTDATQDYATKSATMALDGLDTGFVVVGFAGERMRGLLIKMWGANVNKAATTMTVYYWNGSAWATVGTIDDGTLGGSISMNRSGIVNWEPPAAGLEIPCTIQDTPPFYYYKLEWDNALTSSNVNVDRIFGIAEGDTVGNYAFPVMHQNRLWLFDEVDGARNSARYSGVNAPEVWNGNGSGILYFGDEKKITAGASFFTRFGNAAGYSLVVCKQNQVWLVEGSTSYAVYKVTETLGCPAPYTMTVADIGHELVAGVERQVVIWMSASGPVMFDGVTVHPIGDDISDYWNPLDSTNYINTSYMSSMHGWYDSQYHEYHLCIVTGANTTCDTELVYDLQRRKWFKIARGSGLTLQAGLPVKDTNGRFYTYGTIDTGYMYRLEYGVHMESTDITAYFKSKDFPFSGNLFTKSSIEFLKLGCASKTAESISVTHYADGDTTGTAMTAITNQASGKRIVLDLQRAKILQGITHSFKFSLTHDDANEGFQPLAVGIAYKAYPDPTMV